MKKSYKKSYSIILYILYIHLQYAKIIKTILGTRAQLKRYKNARGAIVAIYQCKRRRKKKKHHRQGNSIVFTLLENTRALDTSRHTKSIQNCS